MTGPDDEPAEDWLPGPEVTPALYKRWRDVRRGSSHAVKMNNPVWEWLIRTGISAYQANHHFQGPESLAAGPAWCFARLGQSRSLLPDGRTILVAGEHEDHYDPDFFIYNDVVVWHPDGTIDIHCYPASDFPPTDFHSATLVGDRVILIGSVGYVEHRNPAAVQVLSLNIDSLKIEKIETTGETPGWLFDHQAVFESDSIIVRGGKIQAADGVTENIDDWKLDLHSFRWKRLTDRQWPRFEFVRRDEEMNHLWQIRNERDMQRFHSQTDLPENVRKSIEETLAKVGTEGQSFDRDPVLLDRLYRPEIEHEEVDCGELGDEYGVYRIKIDGIVVRYVEDLQTVVITVEGQLPQTTLDRLASDLLGKLTRLEGAEFTVRRR